MPFLAVVWLSDDDEAREFVGFMSDDETDDAAAVGRLAGLYRFPKREVKLCRGFNGGCRHTAWKRHKWGHMVHACGLRNPRWWRHLRGMFLDTFGINLLKDPPALFRNPEGWDDPSNVFEFGTTLPTKKGARPE